MRLRKGCRRRSPAARERRRAGVLFLDLLCQLIEPRFSARHQNEIQSRARELARKFGADAGGGAGDQSPRSVTFFEKHGRPPNGRENLSAYETQNGKGGNRSKDGSNLIRRDCPALP